MLKHLPNAITSLNLVCGCLSAIAAINGELTTASYYIGAAAILDFFDGFVARALKAYSEIGKQLDSLADVVSFGVAPGMIMYALAGQCFSSGGFCINQYMPFLIPVFSAIRLAKFNIDTRQSDSFIGVPTPANAMLIASFPLILNNDAYGLSDVLTNQYFLTLFPFVSAYMLVAELPLLALKFKSFGWTGNQYRWLLIGASILSVCLLGYAGVALAIMLYILISIIHNLTQQNKHEVQSRN